LGNFSGTDYDESSPSSLQTTIKKTAVVEEITASSLTLHIFIV